MQVQIHFKERPIYQAPLAVLVHLYYYTTQYGLSVRQFTGEHWKYWEELPKRLRKAQHDPEKLSAVIEELEVLAEGSERRQRRRRAQIEGKWEEKEIVLNAQLLSVLAALPDDLLACGFRNLTGSQALSPSLQLVDLEMQGEDGEHVNFVEPDLLLLGTDCLLMAEIKTRGGSSSSRKYPPNQLLNYLNLVVCCQDFDDPSMPKQFVHLILVPSMETKWLEKHAKWISKLCNEDGRMEVNPDACLGLSKVKSSYNYQRLARLATEVPLYYRSWAQLYEAFYLAVQRYGDPHSNKHWQKVVQEIRELASRAGKFK